MQIWMLVVLVFAVVGLLAVVFAWPMERSHG